VKSKFNHLQATFERMARVFVEVEKSPESLGRVIGTEWAGELLGMEGEVDSGMSQQFGDLPQTYCVAGSRRPDAICVFRAETH
jgi:hypothetical protein